MKTRNRLLEENRALRAENAALKAQLAEILVRVAYQENRIAEIEAENARARKNSSNSSNPPSSDIVKPPRPSPQLSQYTESGTEIFTNLLRRPASESRECNSGAA